MIWTLYRGVKTPLMSVGIFLFLVSLYNSVQINSNSLFESNHGIKFVKRLDEMKGEIKYGRLTASQAGSFNQIIAQEIIKGKRSQRLEVISNTPVEIQEKAQVVTEIAEIPEPAILENLDLKLDQLFYKEAQKDGTYTGGAKISNGLIEEVWVVFPNGEELSLSIVDRMVGNVFQFHDTETGEIQSGMIYEVKKNQQYMITLTSDSKFSGLRLGFSLNGEHYFQDEQQDMGDIQNIVENENIANDNDDPYEALIKEDQQLLEAENKAYEEYYNQQQPSEIQEVNFNF
jgi:uncharacterized protein with FMN-binding domain